MHLLVGQLVHVGTDMEAVDKESRLVSSSLRVSVSLGFTRFGFGELSLG